MDEARDVPVRGGRLDERVNRVPRGHVDGRGAHVEAGVAHHLGGGVGVALAQVGQHDVPAGADAPRDRLPDRTWSDDDDDFAHGPLLTRRTVTSWASGPVTWSTGSGPVAVVLGLVGALDRVVDAGVGRGESDVTLDPADADAAGAAGEGVPNHGRPGPPAERT